jgi:2-dehydropantoate 2-reductase
MRIAVIGAGAVGGAIAARLAVAGHTVEVTTRGDQLSALQSGPLHLRGAWGDAAVRLTAHATLTSTPELAILATKAQDAESALRDNAAHLGGVPVLVIQNGLEGIATAQRALASSPVAGGLAMFAASYLDPGVITITAPGPTFIGGDPETARHVVDTLSAAIDAQFVDNFAGAQWTKLVVNQINALPAVTGLSAQAVLSDRRMRLLVTEAMRETVRVGLAAGVHFASLSGLTHGRLRLLAALPAWIGQLIPLLMKRRMGPVPNPGSTLQSIARGQLSEIDYLSGAVVTTARRLGVAAPVNERLVALVHEVERGGEFLRV